MEVVPKTGNIHTKWLATVADLIASPEEVVGTAAAATAASSYAPYKSSPDCFEN